jgi:stage V sporulation protein R
MAANLMQSPELLKGDNTIPGVKIPPEILKEIPGILKSCRDWGLDFYDTVVEFLDYDGISEVAAYGGFPVRFPHWSFGEQYEDLSRGYEYGMHRIYEMVINTNPCYIYCLDSNTWVDHVTVIAHATGHNDFFKNNIFFSQTSQNMMNELANHGTRIRKLSAEWGKENVNRFINRIMSVETLIDSSKAWNRRISHDPIPSVRRHVEHPRRLKVQEGHEYMEEWINDQKYIDSEYGRIKDEEVRKSIGLFEKPDKDIFGYLKDHAPLKPWQQDIISMMYREAMYFAPQGQTKMLNEGWASRVDSQMMAQYGLAKDDGIVEYAAHKAGVLGGKTSMNPYKLGYMLLTDIEERWNKGQFGKEWDECEDAQVKAKWDKKLGLGHDKIFEVRRHYNDVTALAEFFTQEFCDKHQFYQWKKFPDGTYKIMERDAQKIKAMLIQKYVNRGLPVIKLVEPNYKGQRIFLMEHEWDGRTLHPSKTKETMRALSAIWRGPCAILSKDKDEKQIMYYCKDDQVTVGEPAV